jgi:hypothetical protein
MWSTTRRTWIRCGGLLLTAALTASCALRDLEPPDPPIRATAEQERDRQSESPTSNETRERPTGSSSEDCTVNFDDRDALSQIWAQARMTFAYSTGRSPSGELEHCDLSRTHSDCWTWRQRCSRDDVNVESINYSHFHLGFEKGETCFGLPDPGDGYGPGLGIKLRGTCWRVNWENMPRTLGAHAHDQWIKVWVGNAETQTPMYFDIEFIWLLPGEPVELWFLKRDGTWWYWPELGAAGTWDIRDWGRDVSEVRIRGTVASAGPYRIGALVVRD